MMICSKFPGSARIALLLLCAAAIPSCGGNDPQPPPRSSASSSDAGPSLSQEGRFVVFEDSSQVTVLDRTNATNAVIDPPAPGSDVANAVLTPDGRFVAFDSRPADGGNRQVFVRDLSSGVTTLVSATDANLPGNGESSVPSLSDDGRFVAFQSSAVDLGARSASSSSVLLRELRTGRMESASTSTTGDDVNARISGNGQFVSFESRPAGSGLSAVLLFNRLNGQLLTVSEAPGGFPANAASASPSLSFDGRFVAFESRATNLIAASSPAVAFAGESNIFVRDVLTGVLVTASVPRAAGTPADGDSRFPSLSRNGQRVAFESTATNLTADAVPPGESNVFVRDLGLEATTLVTGVTAEPAAVAAPPPTGAGTSVPVVAPTGTATGIGSGPATVPTGTATGLTTGTPVGFTGTGTTPGSVTPTGTASGLTTGAPLVPTGSASGLNTGTAVVPTGTASGEGTGAPVVPTGTAGGLGTATPVVPTGIAGSSGTNTPVVPTGVAGGQGTNTPVVPTGIAGSPGTSTPVVPMGIAGSLGTSTPVVPTTMTLAAVATGGGRPSISPDGNWVVFESRSLAFAVFLADLRTGLISRIR